MEKLHAIEIDIMIEFRRICDKHGLKYFLYGGTLLGAVRHRGFIPWDDDVDIVMLREDYDKFGEICKKELEERYFYQTCFTDDDFPRSFAKIRANGTFVREPKWDSNNMHKGIFIDILPLDYFPEDDKTGDKMLKRFNWLDVVCKDSYFTFLIIWKQLLFKYYKSKTQMLNYVRRDELLKFSNKHKGNLVCSFGSHYRPLRKRVLNSEWFSGDEYMIFEGTYFRVPSGWKEYLIHLYGINYMELPPLEKRVSHFNIYEVNFNEEEKHAREYEKV